MNRACTVWKLLLTWVVIGCGAGAGGAEAPLLERVRHHEADHDGVTLHYVSLGEGPVVLLLHGFPDFWYTWREQMPVLARDHRVLAMDMRGYNLSGRPAGVSNYVMPLLVGDVLAVIRHAGAERVTLVGHDWGGYVAWSTALAHPEAVARLAILNAPHPRGFLRELATNPEQRANSQYARDFQNPEAYRQLKAETLAAWVKDPAARQVYLDAMQRSDFRAMLHYYQANYPREPYTLPVDEGSKVACPVLLIHGLEDRYLLAGALNDTWQWLAKDLTLVTVPGASHFVQQDAPEFVTRTLQFWMTLQGSKD